MASKDWGRAASAAITPLRSDAAEQAATAHQAAEDLRSARVTGVLPWQVYPG